MPHHHPHKHALSRTYLQIQETLTNVWMDKASSGAGFLFIGTILTEAFYSPNAWVSPQYILSRIGVYSVDTVRRRLEEMVDLGVVEVAEFDRKKLYRATAKAAESTLEAYKLLR